MSEEAVSGPGPGSQPSGTGPQSQEEAERSPWDDPRLPWEGKPGRADILCWAGIVLVGFFYLALIPFRADLVGHHPLLGSFLNGATESIITASAYARIGQGSLAVVIPVAIVGLMKFDILYWWAGRRWGERVVLLLSGRRKAGPKYLARVHRWGRKFSWPAMVLAPFLPFPSPIIYVITGTAGMSAAAFLLLDLAGELLWTGLLAGLGYALGHRAVAVAQAVSHYGLWITIGLVVLVIGSQLRTVRMHR